MFQRSLSGIPINLLFEQTVDALVPIELNLRLIAFTRQPSFFFLCKHFNRRQYAIRLRREARQQSAEVPGHTRDHLCAEKMRVIDKFQSHRRPTIGNQGKRRISPLNASDAAVPPISAQVA
jgi:hypothetical protein